jgi:uncharacterized membrane protein YeaQ/YmgE (transglycosylase-associated protein family)
MENIDLTTLVVQLLSGAIAANIVGAVLRGLSLGTLGDTVAGLIGGAVGGALITTLYSLPEASFAAGMDPMALAHQAAAGAGSGAVVTVVLGILRSIFGGR